MGWGSVAGRCHADLAWISLGIGDELGNCSSWHRWTHHHDEGLAVDARHRRDVADEIEIQLIVKRRVDRCCRADLKERVAIRWRTHDRLGRDIAARARPILDDERLTEPV